MRLGILSYLLFFFPVYALAENVCEIGAKSADKIIETLLSDNPGKGASTSPMSEAEQLQADFQKQLGNYKEVVTSDGRQGWIKEMQKGASGKDVAVVSFGKASPNKTVPVDELQPTQNFKYEWNAAATSRVNESQDSKLLEGAAAKGWKGLVTRKNASNELKDAFYKSAKPDENFISFQQRLMKEHSEIEARQIQTNLSNLEKDFPHQQSASFSQFDDQLAFRKGEPVAITYRGTDGNFHQITATMDNRGESAIHYLHDGKVEELPMKSVVSVRNRQTGTTWEATPEPSIQLGLKPSPKLVSQEATPPVVYDAATPRYLKDALKNTPLRSRIKVELKDGTTEEGELVSLKDPSNQDAIGVQVSNGHGGVQTKPIDPNGILKYYIIDPWVDNVGVNPFLPR